MSIELSSEIEAQLTEEARRLGITVEKLLVRLINGHGAKSETKDVSTSAKPELPKWDLGEVGTLRRRDIYDDGR